MFSSIYVISTNITVKKISFKRMPSIKKQGVSFVGVCHGVVCVIWGTAFPGEWRIVNTIIRTWGSVNRRPLTTLRLVSLRCWDDHNWAVLSAWSFGRRGPVPMRRERGRGVRRRPALKTPLRVRTSPPPLPFGASPLASPKPPCPGHQWPSSVPS